MGKLRKRIVLITSEMNVLYFSSSSMNSMGLVRTLPTSGYDVSSISRQFQETVLPSAPLPPPPTPAGNVLSFDQQRKSSDFFDLFFPDILCQGQPAETVIPLGDGSKFVVCIDVGKGVEQDCPQGLIYHMGTRRCERRMLKVIFFYNHMKFFFV